jgi:WD40 repeat protein
MAISPDGTMLATIPFNGPVKLWDMTTHAEISEMGGSGGYDTSDIAFSSDGQYLASDLATGLWIWRLSDSSLVSSGINTMAFAFSPDGRLIAYSDIARNYDVILVSLEDMQELHTLAGNNGWLTFFVDDTRLMSTNVVETRVWQVEEERLLFVVCNSDQ